MNTLSSMWISSLGTFDPREKSSLEKPSSSDKNDNIYWWFMLLGTHCPQDKDNAT